MKNILRLIGYLYCTTQIVVASSTMSLQNAAKTVNIVINTVDTKEVLLQSNKQIEKFDFQNLNKDVMSATIHLDRIEKAQQNLKELSKLKNELEINNVEIKELKEKLTKAKSRYGRNINKIYKKNKYIDRKTYILVISKEDEDYKSDLENFILNKFSLKQYDETSTLTKSLASSEFRSVIKTKKDFGQKRMSTVYEHIDRSTNTIFKLFEITQKPFKKTKSKSTNRSIESDNDQFEQSDVKVYDLNEQNYQKLRFMIQNDLRSSQSKIKPIIEDIKAKVDLARYKKAFIKSTKQINKVLKKLEKKHQEELSNVEAIQRTFDNKIMDNNTIYPQIGSLLQITRKLLKPYGIPITLETIGSVTIATPKIYKERVDYREEPEYVLRKIKSYISKITVSDLEQSETLIDYSDLSNTTTNSHKSVKFETLHALPYLANNNKIGLLLFASISIKNSVDEDDSLKFDFKYEKMKFIPIQKGYKTIFVAQTKVTLGLVKEFLETHSFRQYFDDYCIDESYLPDDAKDFQNLSEEYFKYPALCFKVEKVEKFVKWVAKKTKRKLVIPKATDWSYIATNCDTTTNCWGNATPDDLVDVEQLPENIYVDGRDDESTITKVAQYPKSKFGLYDMCGDLYEFVKIEDEIGYKGNSFSSYIQDANEDPEEFSDDANPSLGLRLFYIKDLSYE